jgi:hypothetical protein
MPASAIAKPDSADEQATVSGPLYLLGLVWSLGNFLLIQIIE